MKIYVLIKLMYYQCWCCIKMLRWSGLTPNVVTLQKQLHQADVIVTIGIIIVKNWDHVMYNLSDKTSVLSYSHQTKKGRFLMVWINTCFNYWMNGVTYYIFIIFDQQASLFTDLFLVQTAVHQNFSCLFRWSFFFYLFSIIPTGQYQILQVLMTALLAVFIPTLECYYH